MSEARDILNNIVTERQTFTGDTITNLNTGKTFRAEIQEVQDLELNTALGRDARESVMIHTLDETAITETNLGHQLAVTILGKAVKLLVIRRKQNPCSPQVEFGCMNWTEKDS